MKIYSGNEVSMGFLQRLFGGKSETDTQHKQAIPTIKAPDELHKAFSIVFYEVMETVRPFSREDLDAMHETISGGAGHMDQSHWSADVFSRYFADQEIEWPELDEWNVVFTEQGREPLWMRTPSHELSIREMTARLKTADVKTALKTLEIPFASKDTKETLTRLLEENASPQAFASACPAWPDAAAKHDRQERKGRFNLLFRTISGRAATLSNRMRVDAKRKLIIQDDHKAFAAIALKKNPTAFPPFFPGDMTIETIDVEQ